MAQLQAFLEWMRPHWNTLALIVTWIGILVVALRRRLQWRHKRFLTQVNFSLNYRSGNSLVMRTLLERDASEVWLNAYGVKLVNAAAARTTPQNPFLLFKDTKDQDFINRAVLNVLSGRFAETFLAVSLGAPVRSATYSFAITCEKFEDIRTIKLRVLLMSEATMLDLFGPERSAEPMQIRNPIYQARLTTLRAMYDLYRKEQTTDRPILGKVELGVVVGGPSALAEVSGSELPCSTSVSPTA